MKGKKTAALLMSCAMLLSSVPLTYAAENENEPQQVTGEQAAVEYSDVQLYSTSDEGVGVPYSPFEDAENALPRNTMSVAGVGTEHSSGMSKKVLDGDPTSLWEGPWNKTDLSKAWITIKLSEPQTVGGIAQLPRRNSGNVGGDQNGVITGYEVFVSTDGGSTFESVASGTWTNRKYWNYAGFAPVENVTHIKFQATATSEVAVAANNLSVAELRVLTPADSSAISKDELQAVYDKGNSYVQDEYTAESWEDYQYYRNYALNVLDNDYAYQAEIDKAADFLTEADSMLEKIGDLSALESKINEAKQYTNDDNKYYANTFYALTSLIEDAEATLETTATAENVEYYITSIDEAISGLILRDENAPSAFDTAPAMESITRVLGEENADKLSQIELKGIDKKECRYDYYEYYEKDGKLVVAGTTNATILTGFNDWLKYVANCNVSWRGDQVNLPDTLPMPSEPKYQTANGAHRFAGNDMTEQYDGNFWSWEEWEREIDLLALNGFNEVLVYTGQESVFYETFVRLGVDEKTMMDEMPRVSFVPSLFLGGSWRFKADDQLNSPNIMTSMTEDIMAERLEIGQKVCDRLRELGMEPILPGCSGYLAYDYLSARPDAKDDVINQPAWATMPRPGWLKSTSDYYVELAETYYAVQKELFGEVKNFKIDLFNEGGSLGGVDPAEAGAAIQREMLKAHPDATWHIMHWTGPNPDMLKGLDCSKVFIHDIKSSASFDREERWNNASYGLSHLNSMGSRTTMGSRVKDLSEFYWSKMEKPLNKMDGVGIAPEGGHHEPIILESMGELAWQDGPTDGDLWFQQYADRRYGLVNGEPDEHARRAWEILGNTVYSKTGNNPTGDILFAMSPSHSGNSASPTGPSGCGLSEKDMMEVFNELMQVDESLKSTETYRYDLVLVTTQLFTIYSRNTLPKIKEAFNNKDVELYEKLTNQWLENILLLDEITGTNEYFLLGKWIEDARNIASTEEGKTLMEMDARQIVTTWGPRVSGSKGMFLNYSNRTWNGLLRDVYYNQWNMYFKNNLAMLKGEEQPYPEVAVGTNGEVDFQKWYDALWNDFGRMQGDFENSQYASEPTGNTVESCEKVYDALGYGICENVTDLTAEQNEDSQDVKLTWNASETGSPASSFNVYVNDQLYTNTISENCTIKNLTENTEYKFSVAPVNALGNEGGKTEITFRTNVDFLTPCVDSIYFAAKDKIEILFNEKVDRATAENIQNYSVNKNVTITGVQLDETGTKAVLTVEGVTDELNFYSVTVKGIKDISGNQNEMQGVVTHKIYYSANEVLKYDFNNIENSSVTNIIDGAKASVVGPVTGAEGIDNTSAAHFGDVEYVDGGRQDVLFTENNTVGLWVKLDKHHPSASQTLYTHGWSGNTAEGVYWIYTRDGKLNMQVFASGKNLGNFTSSKAVLNVGEWQYVTVVKEGLKFTYYVDGEKIGTMTINESAPISSINNTLKIGSENKPGTGSYGSMMGLNGSIDNFSIFNSALSEEDIKTLASNGYNSKDELVARYEELKDTENVYSVNSYKAFVAALDNAKSVIDNTEATQDDVNNALTQLNSAFENLTYIKGDVNHDGKLTINDATLVQIYLKGNGENLDTETADADGNGEINVEDVSLIQKAIVDLCHVDDNGNII